MPKKFMRSFKFAHHGTRHVFLTQRNVWIHLGAALLVILAARWFMVSLWEWAVLVLTITWVITLEMINTAIEEVVDLAKPEEHPQAAIAKNVAAGAVLVASIGATIVGILIFLPRVIIL